MRTVDEISNYITSNNYFNKKFDFSSVCATVVETLEEDEDVLFACASSTFFNGSEFFVVGVLVITNDRMLLVAKTNTFFKKTIVKSFSVEYVSDFNSTIPENLFWNSCTIEFRYGRENWSLCVPCEKIKEMHSEMYYNLNNVISQRKYKKNRSTTNTSRKHTKTENKQNPSAVPSQKRTETSPQKDSSEITFREGRNTFLASFIVSIPISLIFCMFNPILGLIAIVVFPIIFSIADIKDKPAREREKARLDELRTKAFAMQFENSFRNGENPINSAPTLDTNRLRSDLMDYYGTAMHNGSPMAQADLVHVQGASDAELIKEAKKSGFNLNKYMH